MILAILCQVRLAALLVRVTEKTELALFLSKAKDLRQSENTITFSPVLMVIITIILKDIWGLPIRLADQRRRSEDYHSGRQAQCLGGDACCCNDVENVIFIKYLDSIDLCAYSMAQIFVVTPQTHPASFLPLKSQCNMILLSKTSNKGLYKWDWAPVAQTNMKWWKKLYCGCKMSPIIWRKFSNFAQDKSGYQMFVQQEISGVRARCTMQPVL